MKWKDEYNKIFKEFEEARKKEKDLNKYVRCFETTADLPYDQQPKNWFELIYSCECKGKTSCELNIANVDYKSEFEKM